MALLCGHAVPLCGLGGILRHAVSAFVAQRQPVLRLEISLFRGPAVPFGRLRGVLGHAVCSRVVAHGEFELGLAVSAGGARLEAVVLRLFLCGLPRLRLRLFFRGFLRALLCVLLDVILVCAQ